MQTQIHCSHLLKGRFTAIIVLQFVFKHDLLHTTNCSVMAAIIQQGLSCGVTTNLANVHPPAKRRDGGRDPASYIKHKRIDKKDKI